VRKTRGTKDVKHTSLLSKFTQTFASYSEFKDNPKLVQRFIQYAETTNNPISVYEFMKDKNIGQESELYYYSYSHALEKQHKFNEVLEILQAGLARTKKEQLQIWIDEFELRMEQRVGQDHGKKKRGQMFPHESAEPQEARMY
jgi:hypothetical protein